MNSKIKGNRIERQIYQELKGKEKEYINAHYDIYIDGLTIEVKASKFRIKHHGRGDYGRFRINLDNHRLLMDKDGIYVFVVTSRREKRYFYVSANRLDEMINLSKRKFKTAGISTRWVINNLREIMREELNEVINEKVIE